jgi:hypothetical protein
LLETFEHGETPLLSLFENYEPAGPVGAFDGAEPDFGAGDVGAFTSLFDLLCSDLVAGASDFVADVDSDDEPDVDSDDEPDDDVEVSARLSLR